MGDARCPNCKEKVEIEFIPEYDSVICPKCGESSPSWDFFIADEHLELMREMRKHPQRVIRTVEDLLAHQAETAELAGRLQFERNVKRYEAIAGGRQLIVKYKKGGRIKEDHVYDTGGIGNAEVDLAIGTLLFFAQGHAEEEKRPFEFGPKMIGMYWIGLAPWQKLTHPDQATAADRFEFNCPFRIMDVIEQPRTVIIEIESV